MRKKKPCSLQKRIIRLHLSIPGFATVYVHCTHYMVYGHTLHWTLWLPAGVQLVEFCRLQSREGQKVACGKCNRSFLSPSLFFWRISEEPEWSKGTPYLLMPGGDGLNKVQGYWLQWWWTGLAGNPDRSPAFLGFEWQWRDSSPGVPGLRRCRTPTSHWPSGGQ